MPDPDETIPCTLSLSDLEALFCIALLQTLPIDTVSPVLRTYLDLRDNPVPALEAVGRRPPRSATEDVE